MFSLSAWQGMRVLFHKQKDYSELVLSSLDTFKEASVHSTK